MLELRLLDFEGSEIPVREDGYWNLTAMCKAHGKNMADFLRLKSTQEYLIEFNYDVPPEKRLSPDPTIPMSDSNNYGCKNNSDVSFSHIGATSLCKPEGVWIEPIEVSKGGRPQEQGTWGHPEVALKLAAWINPRLEVWVYRTTTKLMTAGEVKLRDELGSLRLALAKKDELLDEVSVELILAEHRNDQLRYENDELTEMAQWRRENSFSGGDN